MNKKTLGNYRHAILGFCRDLVIACAVVVLLNTFVIQSLRVEGGSMAPTLEQGDLVLLNRWIYKFKAPDYGDVVGFYSDAIERRVVKRIIGKQGDVIDYKEGMIYCNGQPIQEGLDYAIVNVGDLKYPYYVPEGSYFVLGDNYNQSIDSRFTTLGSVKESQLIGRIQQRIWPMGKGMRLK